MVERAQTEDGLRASENETGDKCQNVNQSSASNPLFLLLKEKLNLNACCLKNLSPALFTDTLQAKVE